MERIRYRRYIGGWSKTIFMVSFVLAVSCDGPTEDTAQSTGSEVETTVVPPTGPGLPPSADTALAAIESSPRHGEWVEIQTGEVPISTWVVYPERSDSAPIVLVIHEIYGLTDWIRGVADQFAAEGFIAVAPDLLSGMGPDGGGTEAFESRDDVVATIRTLEAEERTRRLDAVREYSLDIPAGNGRIGSVGFCWGGMSSFAYAVSQVELNAAVVYYGTSPEDEEAFVQINAPVLGLYGGDDERVNSTIPRAEDSMARLGKPFESILFDGAGHGFLRAQNDRDGANMRATEQAWPRTVNFFREHLGN